MTQWVTCITKDPAHNSGRDNDVMPAGPDSNEKNKIRVIFRDYLSNANTVYSTKTFPSNQFCPGREETLVY